MAETDRKDTRTRRIFPLLNVMKRDVVVVVGVRGWWSLPTCRQRLEQETNFVV